MRTGRFGARQNFDFFAKKTGFFVVANIFVQKNLTGQCFQPIKEGGNKALAKNFILRQSESLR